MSISRPERLGRRHLVDRIWSEHVVRAPDAPSSAPDILYIDLHLLHEVTSPQAFTELAARGAAVRRPRQCLATMDHCTPTTPAQPDGEHVFASAAAREQVEALTRNTAAHRITLYPLGHPRRGIVHVIAPELGLVQPGMTVVCGDSHTSTHGAFGALAFGIGTGQVAHVLATQCLLSRRPPTMRVRLDGVLRHGVTAKDMALALISRIGSEGGTGSVFEHQGSAVRAMSMEQRMTLCNMSIEAGARAGLIAPDDTTFTYLAGRPFAPAGQSWDTALSEWRALASAGEPCEASEPDVVLDASALEPLVTFGTSPGMSVPIASPVPDPEDLEHHDARRSMAQALEYMKIEPGQPMLGRPVDVVFVGSCTNGRLSDLEDAAQVLRGRRVHTRVRALVVPGSVAVKREAEVKGLRRVFEQAGAEWREPGCSMCLAMNGDHLQPGQLAVSTSNRSFEGRQGPGGRTVLASPLTAAASAISGSICDPREMI